ncbi:hypothetical protein CR511_18985 [Pseudomonas putida]|nr:hypothetical protein CR511_18985 [Pseudomonas putida]
MSFILRRATDNYPVSSVIGRMPLNSGRLYRFYCGDRLVGEMRAESFLSFFQFNGQLLGQKSSDDVGFFISLLVTDQAQSVLGVTSADSLLWPIAYSPYGYRSPASVKAAVNGFNGERPDFLTQNYVLGNGHRVFDLSLKRFNSPDSRSPFGGGGLNSYCYCVGDPINLYDPDGRSPVQNWKPISMKDRYAAKYLKKMSREELNLQGFNTNISEYHDLPKSNGSIFGSTPSLAVRPPRGQAPKGWDLIGVHGSSIDNRESLQRGLDPKFLERRRGKQEYGDGFYVAVNSGWSDYSSRAGNQKFYVYTQNIARLTPGKHIDFTPAHGSSNWGSTIQIVIREPAYDMIAIREQRVGAMVPPRSHEAPF